MTEIPSAAPDLTLRDASGRLVSLGDLWQERPLVLVFLRWLG